MLLISSCSHEIMWVSYCDLNRSKVSRRTASTLSMKITACDQTRTELKFKVSVTWSFNFMAEVDTLFVQKFHACECLQIENLIESPSLEEQHTVI